MRFQYWVLIFWWVIIVGRSRLFGGSGEAIRVGTLVVRGGLVGHSARCLGQRRGVPCAGPSDKGPPNCCHAHAQCSGISCLVYACRAWRVVGAFGGARRGPARQRAAAAAPVPSGVERGSSLGSNFLAKRSPPIGPGLYVGRSLLAPLEPQGTRGAANRQCATQASHAPKAASQLLSLVQ